MTTAAVQHWVKRYRLECDVMQPEFEIVIELDHRVVTATSLRERYEFWHRPSVRTGQPDDGTSYLHPLLRQLGVVILGLATEGYNREGIVARFADGIEGWPEMDGSAGWSIVRVDPFEIDPLDFTVTEL